MQEKVLPELSRPFDLGENGVGLVQLAAVGRAEDVKVIHQSSNFPSDPDDYQPNWTDVDQLVNSEVEVRA